MAGVGSRPAAGRPLAQRPQRGGQQRFARAAAIGRCLAICRHQSLFRRGSAESIGLASKRLEIRLTEPSSQRTAAASACAVQVMGGKRNRAAEEPGRCRHCMLDLTSTNAWSKASTRITPSRGYSRSTMMYTASAITAAKPIMCSQLGERLPAMP